MNFGNCPMVPTSSSEDKKQDPNSTPTFPNGKTTLKFDEFINIIKESCVEKE